MAGKAADEYKANTAYYDSGANKHFFKYKPDQYQPYAKPTFVMNANGAKDPILGSGTISLGSNFSDQFAYTRKLWFFLSHLVMK